MAYSNVRVYFEIGHEASIRNKRTPNGFTHDWKVYLRGADGAEIHHFVDKVIFHLHETFPNPKRVLKDPPYTVKESGYAGFNLPIDVYLKNNNDGNRKIRFYYDLTLQPVLTGSTQISNVIREKHDFSNPNEEFRRKLIEGGAIGVNSDGSDKSNNVSNSVNSNHFDDTKHSPHSKGKGVELPAKKHKPSKEPRSEESRLTNSFAELFGTPIVKHSPNPKPPPKPAESKSHDKVKEPIKPPKPSPSKEKEREKDRDKRDKEEKSSREKERNKDKDRHKTEEKSNKDKRKSGSSSVLSLKDLVKKDEDKPKKQDEKEKSSSKTEASVKPEKKHDDHKKRDDKDKKEKHKKKEVKDEPHDKKEVKEEKEKEKIVEKKESVSVPKEPVKEKEDKMKHKVEKEEKKLKSKEKSVEVEKTKHKHKKKDKHRKDEEREKPKKKDKEKEKQAPPVQEVLKTKMPPPVVPRERSPPPPPPPPPSPPPPVVAKPSTNPLNALLKEMVNDDSDSDFSGSEDAIKIEPKERSRSPPPPAPLPPPPPVVKPKEEKRSETPKEEKPEKSKKKDKRKDDEHRKKKRKHKDRDSSKEPQEKIAKVSAETTVKEEKASPRVSADGQSRSPSPEETLFTEDYINQLKDLQHKIMTLQDNADLQKVVQVISETGQFEITQRTFDFDLCALDPSTVKMLQDMFISA